MVCALSLQNLSLVIALFDYLSIVLFQKCYSPIWIYGSTIPSIVFLTIFTSYIYSCSPARVTDFLYGVYSVVTTCRLLCCFHIIDGNLFLLITPVNKLQHLYMVLGKTTRTSIQFYCDSP